MKLQELDTLTKDLSDVTISNNSLLLELKQVRYRMEYRKNIIIVTMYTRNIFVITLYICFIILTLFVYLYIITYLCVRVTGIYCYL